MSGLTDVTATAPVVSTPMGTERHLTLVQTPPTGGGVVPANFLPRVGRKRIEWLAAVQNHVTLVGVGMAPNPVMSSAVAIANTSYYESAARARSTSTGVANAQSAFLIHPGIGFRGTPYNTGGFLLEIVWGYHALNADSRLVAGLTVGSMAASSEPTTMTNVMAFAMSSTDTVWQFMHNDASGTASTVSLGANLPRPTPQQDVYYGAIWCAPAVSTVNYYLVRMDDPTRFSSGFVGIDIPAGTQGLIPRFITNTGPTAAVAVSIDFMRAQFSTDL